MSDFFPVDWEMSALGSCVEDCRSGASLGPSDFKSSGVPVIPKKSVQRGGILVFDDEKEYCSYAFRTNNENCIINSEYVVATLRDLVPSGPSIGLIGELKEKGEFLLAQGVYGLRLNEKLDKQYLAQLSNLGWYRARMREMMVGSTQVHIRVREFLENVIPIPPLPEQKKIAEILSGIDRMIQAMSHEIRKKEIIANAATERLFEITLSKSDTSSIGDITTLITKGTTPTSVGLRFSEKGISFVKAQSISASGEILQSTFSFIDEFAHQQLSRSSLRENDVLVTIAGTIGRSGVVTEDLLPANTNQAVALLRPDPRQAISSYLSLWLRSERCQNHFTGLQTVGAQPNVSLKQISETPFPMVDIQTQLHIASIANTMYSEIRKLTAKREKHMMLKNSLSLDLLSGRKRVRV